MTLCDDKHDEVCFTGSYCPVCAMRAELSNEIRELETAIEKFLF